MDTKERRKDMLIKRNDSESGVALLTVLALLAIFAVVLVGFTYTIRMEEGTIQTYTDTVTVQESTEAAIQGVLAQVARDLDPSRPNIVLGRPQRSYVSLMDPWAKGYAGRIPPNLIYDARSHVDDLRPERELQRLGVTVYPTPIPISVDEDPPGDVTGKSRIQIETRARQTASGDRFPGLGGIDDDLDGVIDNSEPFDDDEDYRIDEDGYDLRRSDVDGGTVAFPPGTGYDADGDRRGVTDENSKININFAGNNFGRSGGHTYNMGISPTELDLPLFIYNRVVRYQTQQGTITELNINQAEQLAQNIVSYRYGNTLGNNRLAKPGVDNNDDNNNNSPSIVSVEEYSAANRDLSRFDGEPYVIIGNQADDDDDGLLNEEDERYIGPSTDSTGGTPLTGTFSHNRAENYRPGDKIDNQGDGFIDESREGVDDPSEFSVFKPKGDDRPFATVEDIALVQGISNDKPVLGSGQFPFPTLYEILRDSVTIYSQSDEVSGVLSGIKNEVAKINPNGSTNWRAADLWSLAGADTNRADFQYSPPVKLDDLFVLQADKDGDWQLEDEINMTDGIDNDGDGLIDEPSDDWDGNLYPSPDFDGFGEADVGAPSLQQGGDFDNDNRNDDSKRTSPNDFDGNLAILDRDARHNDILPGLVAQGNGIDDDGDNLVDDTGDFNGDGLFSYDPEFHVTEDVWGDPNGDGYPGIGGKPGSDENTLDGILTKRPDITDDLLVTNPSDDDFDGFADFYDPQVLAAMFTPELDGVDNDADGEVDEIGERYIAAYDDDEDGRMDEDPPDFQLAFNLVDFVDTFMPFPVVSNPQDVRQILGRSITDPVLADPVTVRVIDLFSSRTRGLRMNPRMLAGPNVGTMKPNVFTEQMRLMLPNPPDTGFPVRFEGIEAIRINEVMAKPVIRLEAEDVIEEIVYNPNNPGPPQVRFKSGRFSVDRGGGDDGIVANRFDSNWGSVRPAAEGSSVANLIPSYNYYHRGFENTLNTLLPIVNMDSLAPAFIFSVSNAQVPTGSETFRVGSEPEEVATWTFTGIPAGLYDVVLYLHPNDSLRSEVRYIFQNNQEILFRSDYNFIQVTQNTRVVQPISSLDPIEQERIRRDTARLNVLNRNEEHRLNYRLTPYPIPPQDRVTSTGQRVVVGQDGVLRLTIIANAPESGWYRTSFDRLELINFGAQYVELVNLTTEDIDLSGYQISTPYGTYVLPENSIIGRMKPSFETDDGKELVPEQGKPGTGVPFEPLLKPSKMDDAGAPLNSDELEVEDNKLLVAFDRELLRRFIRDNYPRNYSRIDDRIVQPRIIQGEFVEIMQSIQNIGESPSGPPHPTYRNSQLSDIRFKLVDKQDDILTNNPREKQVTLYDPAGNYIDSFRYRTTFNNAIVDIPGNGLGQQNDIVALPGYTGFETFERTDPTYFRTEMAVDPAGNVSGDRYVPSSIRLDAIDAIVRNISVDSNLEPGEIGGYVNTSPGIESDANNGRLRRFTDPDQFPPKDAHWNGWDFIGDYHEYDADRQNILPLVRQLERTHSIAREAALDRNLSPRDRKIFYQMLGGFENALHVVNPLQRRYTAFTWRIGLRELIRAGYDPDVDDQLTVRVLGRKLVDPITGRIVEYDLPVGEVLVLPSVRVINPGETALHEPQNTTRNRNNPYFEQLNQQVARPVFSKLRNGDTAFTIDLRDNFGDLTRDLRTNNQPEPTIEITVIIRKSTPDINAITAPNIAQFRPDLAAIGQQLTGPTADGDFTIGGAYAGHMGADNYFFKGIELFGRGRLSQNDDEESNQRRALLAGTPGRDNTGYVPAYPRRRMTIDGSRRDELDIVDNSGYVKNGPLATLGEISRLYTGKKFETVNMPLIPQRIEDKAITPNRIINNVQLAQYARGNNPEFRIQLAQRERLDQWENQYSQIYNMITTSETGIRAGLININTAPREVLVALPFCPPKRVDKNGYELAKLLDRHFFNTLCADFIISGRKPEGHDMHFGIHNLDDDMYITNAVRNAKRTAPDTMSDYKLATVGRMPQYYKNFDIIKQRFSQLNLQPKDIMDRSINFNNVYLTTEVSLPDDGPYSDIGTLLSQMTHMSRRDRFSDRVRMQYDRTYDFKLEDPGDLREMINAQIAKISDLTEPLTTEDMEAIMNRISSLITVRSRAFGIIARGRVFDGDGNIAAQRTLESVYQR